jgi:hypothetical protein
MLKRSRLVLDESSAVEVMARFREQDDEFCRRLRAAIDNGYESCPTTVSREPCTKRPILHYQRPDS